MMHMTRTVVVVAVSLILGVSFGNDPRASAHALSEFYYLHRWSAVHHTGLHVTWRFSPNFPTDLKTERMKDGFAKWNRLNQQMEFEQLPRADYGYDLPCPGTEGYNGIFWRDLPTGIHAETRKCDHEDQPRPHPIHNFWIAFDNNETNWHGGTADTIGQNELDFEAVAAHEVGHATGFRGHYDSREAICEGAYASRNTLCPFFPSWDDQDPFDKGPQSTEFRSLETHDIHTFDSAYPDK